MSMVKTSLLNSIAVSVKMLTLLVLNKVLAIFVGPSGYVALGNFQNAVQIITTFASGAINTGVTKYTAEYYDDELKQQLVWRTAGSIAFLGSLITAVLISIFNKELAVWFLKDIKFGGVFLWFAATLVLFVFNTLLLAILNGKKDIARYVIANIAGSVFALILTVLMVIQYELYGALIALAIYQSLAFFVTLYICNSAKWFKFSYLIGRIDSVIAKNLAKFTAMALTAAICMPVSHILVRNHLAEVLDLNYAGYWDAMWRLSAAYLMLVTTTLSVYYLPRLSELSDAFEIRKEILQGYKLILPVSVICGLVIYIMRDTLILMLFSESFLEMRELFAWQMIGDTLKIAGWLLAYLVLSKAIIGLYIFSEILFSLGFVLLTKLFTIQFGFEGVAIAHALNYLLYFVFLFYMLRKKGFIK